MKTIIFFIALFQLSITVSLCAQEDELIIMKFDDGTYFYTLKNYKEFEDNHKSGNNVLMSTSKYDRGVKTKYINELSDFYNRQIDNVGWPFDGPKYKALHVGPLPHGYTKEYSLEVTLNNKGKIVIVGLWAPSGSKLKNKEQLIKLLKALSNWDVPYYNQQYLGDIPDTLFYSTGSYLIKE